MKITELSYSIKQHTTMKTFRMESIDDHLCFIALWTILFCCFGEHGLKFCVMTSHRQLTYATNLHRPSSFVTCVVFQDWNLLLLIRYEFTLTFWGDHYPLFSSSYLAGSGGKPFFLRYDFLWAIYPVLNMMIVRLNWIQSFSSYFNCNF